MNLDDLRLFAAVAQRKSFTGAGLALDVPKQTVSRRIVRLEAALGVQLLRRTTRSVELTDVGAAFAQRCAEIVRQAEDAARAVTDARDVPRGRLRVTADPVFGEAFVAGLIVEYATRYPDVEIDAVFTRRHVDLVEEGFDVAFRVGQEERADLLYTNLMPADIRYCASPAYVQRRGSPATPEELAGHDCILVLSEGTSTRWPFVSRRGPVMQKVSGRLRFNSFAAAHDAARAGLGIAIFPAFKCAADIADGRLTPVLDDWCMAAGSVSVVHATHQFLSPRVRAFIELATRRFTDPGTGDGPGRPDRPS